ncbi:MAG TPA: hypothetical protein DDW52_04275 [Planctomycetaceae bacterium]|nr:hypothetical protein [Planctomycetaceae bacterium]
MDAPIRSLNDWQPPADERGSWLADSNAGVLEESGRVVLMVHTRGYRGWMAAMTVGVTLTLLILCVGKYIHLPSNRFVDFANRATAAAASTSRGKELPIADPGAAPTYRRLQQPQTTIDRVTPSASSDATELLRRPPQPAANVAIQAPIGNDELVDLPLTDNDSEIVFLMESMDSALESPIRVTSSTTRVVSEQTAATPRRGNIPAVTTALVPRPQKLLDELAAFEDACQPGYRLTRADYDDFERSIHLPSGRTALLQTERDSILNWIEQVRDRVQQLVSTHGLENPQSRQDTEQLREMAKWANQFAEGLASYPHARRLLSLAYSVERRVDIWLAIQNCLDETSIGLSRSSSADLARDALSNSIENVEALLGETGDEEAWREYLLLEQLQEWVGSEQNIWSEGNGLALNALSRLRWERLSEPQRDFLDQDEFAELARHLESWSRDPVDYRQLLIDLEELELSPLDRNHQSLAGAIQVLRTSPSDTQRTLAVALNNHYRNANMRFSLSRELLEGLLPEADIQVRPVRRRILGADTRGDSTVHTKMQLDFMPDPSGWHVGIGVLGNIHANTASSKGPATFHNTSLAEINSRRFVRMDPMGYSVSSDPTNVSSREYLRKMSTDFDGLPIIGDFIRVIVREQFDQKRTLAQRISQRIMAQEADEEFDRRLNTELRKAEDELQRRITGPLHRLDLDPMVVSMSTTPQRLEVRYRVAGHDQMASHSPRPRAPTDSLMSMQVHQSTINNTISNLNLGGRTWKLTELATRITEVFGRDDWQLSDEIPDDVTIRFAEQRPAFVDIADGRLRLTLRIAQLSRGGKKAVGKLIVTSSYVPIAEGLKAELIRTGTVEIMTPRTATVGQRLLARTIFAKVFVSRPRIALISERWQNDPRAAGLAVSQVEMRDNWLSVALSTSESENAEEVASRSRFLKQNY